MTACKTCGYVVTDDGLKCVCNIIQQANLSLDYHKNDKPTYEEAKKIYISWQSHGDNGEFYDMLARYFKDEVLK